VQRGVELDANWTRSFASFIRSFSVNVSATYNDYRFGQYVNDGNDYSGNQVTGVAPFIVALGLDLTSRPGFYLRVTGNFVDRMPLNDANTDYASGYLLLGARAGYRVSKRIPIDLYFGTDNILNQRYSLGNDLNAAGKRYYNAAAPLNFYVGLNARASFKTSK
jgi:iron complex outermembrane receptor protein